jgi:anhydro-N-acetylmuramic acid kinase
VPYADWLLFARKEEAVATLNIGGIANFTLVTPKLDDVFAFDTGPGNMVIDSAMRLATGDRELADWDGAAAARGQVIQRLFDKLVDHPYFARTPPKSTGRDEFGLDAYLLPALEGLDGYSPDDLVATVTVAVAQTIVDALRHIIEPHEAVAQVIVSGGGAKNSTVMRLLREGFGETPMVLTDEYGIPSDAREAVAFAILGNETLCGTPANVPRATGARHHVVLGKVTPP